MAEEFTPITTQEQFNEAMQARMDRFAKKYEGYTSPAELAKIRSDYDKQITDLTNASEAQNKKYADYDRQLADRDARIKGYETASVKTRIAHEEGLPYELAGRLSGESEDDIRKDAQALVKLIGKKSAGAPMAQSPDDVGVGGDPKNAALKSLARTLHKGD